ncbi:hypothetical protein G6F65_018589 [Rhizopus arrhizus]|nr:hypothetical protein G6F65_018589 [Rhizopus arrhizus]
MRASHGERSNTVSAASSMQQGAGIAAAGTAAGQLAIGVAGDVEEACVIHVAAHAVHCRHAFRAGATAAERDQQGRAVALQVQRRVGQQAGGMHHAHVGRPLRVDRVGHHLGDEAGAAGAGEQHALVGIVEAVAEEGLQAIAGTRQILRKGFPQRRLLGDFGSGIGSAQALPGGHIGKQGDVHSEVPVGPAHHLCFLSKCQIPKVKRKKT